MTAEKKAPWDAAAELVQNMGIAGDTQKEEIYTDDAVRRAIVYTRQDIILVVVYLSWINRHLRNITWALVVLLLVAVFIALHWFPHL